MPSRIRKARQVASAFVQGLIRTVSMESQGAHFGGARYSSLDAGVGCVGQVLCTSDFCDSSEADGLVFRGGSKMVPILRALPGCPLRTPYQLMPEPRGAFSNMRPRKLRALDDPPPGMLAIKSTTGMQRCYCALIFNCITLHAYGVLTLRAALSLCDRNQLPGRPERVRHVSWGSWSAGWRLRWHCVGMQRAAKR